MAFRLCQSAWLSHLDFSRVTYCDIEGIEHTAEVTAASLYEAVALGVARFRRDDGWVMCPPGPGCEFHVKLLPDSPVTYRLWPVRPTAIGTRTASIREKFPNAPVCV